MVVAHEIIEPTSKEVREIILDVRACQHLYIPIVKMTSIYWCKGNSVIFIYKADDSTDQEAEALVTTNESRTRWVFKFMDSYWPNIIITKSLLYDRACQDAPVFF